MSKQSVFNLLYGKNIYKSIINLVSLGFLIVLMGYIFLSKQLDSKLETVYRSSEAVGWESYLSSIKSESNKIDEYFIEDVISELEDYGESLTNDNLLSLSGDSGLVFLDLKIEAFEDIDSNKDNKTKTLNELKFTVQQYCEMLIVIAPFSSSSWEDANSRGHFIKEWLLREDNFNCPIIIKPLHQVQADFNFDLRLALLVKDENI